MMLLERKTQTEILEERLGNARRGMGHVVCIFGDAGAGKTSLLRQFADATDAQVLWGACEDLTTPEALGPLRDWARESGQSAFAGIPQSGDQIELFSEVLEALSEKCTLAIIEDLHWADGATLDLVRFIGRRIANKPVLIIVSARTEDRNAHRRLRAAIGQIPPDQKSYIEVHNLTLEAVGLLAQQAGKDGDNIYRLTDGNAFFVTEILRGGGLLPATVRDAVLARFDQLPLSCRRAIQAIAVMPRRAEIWALQLICPGDFKEIERAVLAGLIVAGEDDYSFRHEIARRAMESAIPPEQHRALHHAALNALRRDPKISISRLVHHAEAAGDGRSLAELAPLAGAAASQAGAHREAARHYATALKFAQNLNRRQRARLFEKLAFELHLVGKMKEAIAAHASALDLNRTMGDRFAEGDSLRWMSRVHYLSGDRLSAVRYAHQAMESLKTETPGAELAMAFSNLGQLSMLADDPKQTLCWSGKAIEIATQLGRNDIVAHALNNSGGAQRWTDKAATRDNLARSLQIALDNNLPEHAARGFTNLGYVEINWLEHANARRHLDDGLRYCEERNLDTWRTYMNGCYAHLLLREGKWDEAASAAMDAISASQTTPMLCFPATTALARLRVRRGDPEIAQLLDPLESYFAKGNEPPRLLMYASISAEHAWVTDSDDRRVHGLICQASRVAVEIGDIWSAGDLWFWGQLLGIKNLPKKAIAQPYQLMVQGRWAEAAAAWSELQCPYDRALALMTGNQAAQREGLNCLDALGAKAVSDRYRRHLRGQGMRSIPRGPQLTTRTNPAGLTRRQMTVLELIAEGLSNADIAERLFVSAKTVDHHVSAILAKLNARTRGQAVAFARTKELI